MKKISDLSNNDIDNIVSLYLTEIKSTRDIGDIYNISKTSISKILKNNNVPLRNIGSIYLGGKSASYKRNYMKHQTKKNLYHKNWREDKKKELKLYHDSWRESNRDNLNEYKRIYEKNKKDSDPHYKFATYTRTAIWETLKMKKGTGIFIHMDYTLEKLIDHIESLFTIGMSWDNYGEWHLDHIIPLSFFKFNSYDDIEFKECWALSNLQPLWSTTREIDGIIYVGNLNKNNRI